MCNSFIGKNTNHLAIAFVIWTAAVLLTRPIYAQPSSAVPVSITEIAGKTGQLRVTLPKRSPLSAPEEIAKRIKLKPEEADKDYDLSKQIFEVYVPPQPDADGKYGLMDGIVFAGGHGFAPAKWKPIFDKYHIIWVAPSLGGDDQPPLARIGYALDVLENARQTWPISDDHVYLSLNTSDPFVGEVGLCYPDVFSLILGSSMPAWYTKLPDLTQPTLIWATDRSPVPPPQYLQMAKSHSRFFFASHDLPGNFNANFDVIFRRGYQQGGFHNVQMIKVSQADMDVWTTYDGGWVDRGIQFLTPTKPTAAATQSAAAPTPADADTAKSDRMLSVAKGYILANRYDIARDRLQSLIDQYPNSQAAQDAQALLKRIEGK